MNAYHRKIASSLFAAMSTLCLLIACAGSALAQTAVPPQAAAPLALTEAQKIQMLIHNIEVMKDARFVRNGSDYDGAAAADHLRLKLRSAGDRLKTAQDFITYLASKSSFSGKPYMIRFKDGHEVESGTYFRTMLAQIEHPVAAPRIAPVAPAPIAAAPIATLPSAPAPAPAISEAQKIQSLIHGLELMRSAHFIRDGRRYSTAQAAADLRRQLRRAGNHDISAQDFITSYASLGARTRRPNSVRFASGQQMDAGEYFRARLAILEHSATAIRPIPATPAPVH